MIATVDDHETANNAWRDGAENHTPGVEGAWAQRKAVAIQAYFEWMPIRVSPPSGELGEVRRIYRKFAFGTLTELFMLDLRSYRSEQPTSPVDNANIFSPTRTMLGTSQSSWFTTNLIGSGARWKVIGNSVQIAPIIVINSAPYLDAGTQALLQNLFGIPAGTTTPTPLNVDSWDGYSTARNQVLGLIGGAVTGQPIPNCVFLTGDIHSSYICDIPANPTTYNPASPVSLATEFVVTSVTSDNVNELVGAPERVPASPGVYVRNPATPPFEGLLQAFNGWLKDVKLDFHGYSVVDITSTRLQMDQFILRSDSSDLFAADPRIDPNARVIYQASFQTTHLSQTATTASGPVGPRA
jgi:alkaline phosphatase D